MFSEPYEQDLLWLKFNIEDPFIDEWVIMESSYTFQGKSKLMYIKDILQQSRFSKFVDKIKIIQLDTNYNFGYEPTIKLILKRKIKHWLNKHYNTSYGIVPYSELSAFHAEYIQRQACVPYLKNHYDRNDVVLICDVDEIFDFGDGKFDEFDDIIKQNSAPFLLIHKLFYYDFNNESSMERHSAVVRVKHLKSKVGHLHMLRHPKPSNRIIVKTKRPLLFEYTSCFSREQILRKLNTYAHYVDAGPEAVDFCLQNNIAICNPATIDRNFRKHSEYYYDIVDINKDTAPQFIRDNFDQIKTGVVSEDYKNNRAKNSIEPLY